MFNPGKKPSPASVPQADNEDEGWKAGEHIGAFTAYLRRPKSSARGLTGQFFGENGADADIIATFHLTRYKDMLAKVNVWMIKNAQGKLMVKDGKYPLLAQFIGTIRRPVASDMGQTAMIFADNGENADAVVALNQSRYLDALVYVEVIKAEAGMKVEDLPADMPSEELKAESQRMTQAEVAQFKRDQRKASEGWRLLRVARFFHSHALWQVLGGEQAYREWIMAQPCSSPGTSPCEETPCLPYPVPGSRRLGAISMCQTHATAWDQGRGDAGAQSPDAFLSSRQMMQTQHWAEDRLRQVLGAPQGHDPLPGRIYAWAVDNNLRNSLPASFVGLI